MSNKSTTKKSQNKKNKSSRLKFLTFIAIFAIFGAAYLMSSQALTPAPASLTINTIGLPNGTVLMINSSGALIGDCGATWQIVAGTPKTCTDYYGSGIGDSSWTTILTWLTSVNAGGSSYNISQVCWSKHPNVGGCSDGTTGQAIWEKPGENGVMTLTYSQATTTPPAPTPTPTPSTSKPSTPKPTSPTAAPTPITSPSTDAAISITHVNDQVVPAEQLIINHGQPLTISGRTVPNGIVALYIFSDPIKVTVAADGAGLWSYEATNLAVGQHHIEAEVTNPVTKETSARTNLIAFTINGNDQKTATLGSNNSLWIWAVGLIIFLGCGLLGYKIFSSKKH